LPTAHLCRPAPVRGPALRLPRGLFAAAGRPALRLQLRRLPPTGPPVPVRLRGWPPAPLFAAARRGGPRALAPPPRAPRIPSVADARVLQLAPGRRLRTRLAGLFLFVPLLARLGWPQLVERAGYPGSAMVPAASALLSLLALKLVDKERRSHADDLSFDGAAGTVAGLSLLPKKSFLAEYSYRPRRDTQRRLLPGWAGGLSALLCPAADAFALDFHPIPHRGEGPALERHYASTQGRARPGVLAFFALEDHSKVLCYAN